MGLQVDFSRLNAMDFLDLAIEVEKEAREHYEQLASWMASSVHAEVVEFFNAMAGREQRHVEQLMEQRQKLFGDEPPRHSDAVPWEVEAPEYDAMGSSPDLREALEMALAMEARAYQYYTDAKEYASDARVVDILDGFRRAEAEHQRLVQEQLDKLP